MFEASIGYNHHLLVGVQEFRNIRSIIAIYLRLIVGIDAATTIFAEPFNIAIVLRYHVSTLNDLTPTLRGRRALNSAALKSY